MHALAAGCTSTWLSDGNAGGPESRVPTTRDFSDFDEFEFSQQRALGFCPLLDAPARASIRRQDGAYTFEISLIEAGDRSAGDACEDAFVRNVDCVVIRDLAARELSADEAQRVRDAFSSVAIVRGTLPNGVCNDPCRIIRASWDGVGAASDLSACATSGDRTFDQIGPDQVDALVDLLNDLAGAAAAPPPPALEPADPTFLASVAGVYHRQSGGPAFNLVLAPEGGVLQETVPAFEQETGEIVRIAGQHHVRIDSFTCGPAGDSTFGPCDRLVEAVDPDTIRVNGALWTRGRLCAMCQSNSQNGNFSPPIIASCADDAPNTFCP